MNVKDLKRGDVVRSVRDIDPAGAGVKQGELGVVFEEHDAYGDGNGPMVRWTRKTFAGPYVALGKGGACNVYDGDVEASQ